MIKRSLKETKRGWFISGFLESIYKSNFETGIKRYKAGDSENSHHHRISDEITVIVSGRVRMNGIEYIEDDIIIIEKNESTDFMAIEDSITCVVKPIYSDNDKYED